MPSSQQILEGLADVTNGWRSLAIAWHVVLGAFLSALLLGWRPGKRLTGLLLAAPIASVSALAWATGNPFNGTLFFVITAGLVGVALRLPSTSVRIGPPWLTIAGGVLIAFGWVYPHFLRTDSWAAYLYAAPLGLIPCPTLSAVAGVSLVVEGLGSTKWSLTLAAIGVLYGVIGVFRLGVVIDLVLLVGALTLVLVTVVRPGWAVAASGGTKA